VHGANRLASNSLLEGLVFGARAGLAAARYAGKREQRDAREAQAPLRHDRRRHTFSPAASEAAEIRASLRSLMWEKVGIVRNRKDLTAALKQLRKWDRAMKGHRPDRNLFELKNMITAAMLITNSALSREGSVGAHFRSDFPTKGRSWRKRTVIERQEKYSR